MNKEYSWTENQTDDIWYHGKFASVEECIKDAIGCGKKPGERHSLSPLPLRPPAGAGGGRRARRRRIR